jgi:hypothetical protein
MLKPMDLSHSQEYLKKEMENKMDENRKVMKNKMEKDGKWMKIKSIWKRRC